MLLPRARGHPGFQHNCTVVKQGMSKGYRAAISDMRCQERYDQKLTLIGGEDPYELPQFAWIDDVDAWPAITYIHIGMYLVYSPSSYTSEALIQEPRLLSAIRRGLGQLRRCSCRRDRRCPRCHC